MNAPRLLQKAAKAFATVVAVLALDMAILMGSVLWLSFGVPWLYRRFGPWGDWWVFFLAMLMFTIPLWLVSWLAIRWWQAMRKRWRES